MLLHIYRMKKIKIKYDTIKYILLAITIVTSHDYLNNKKVSYFYVR